MTAQNYQELAALYDKYSSKGLEILAFPCNQFGGQEPGSNSEIQAFAKGKGAKFPVFGKIDVNGPEQDPLYEFLKQEQSGGFFGQLLGSDIKWNFAKFLVDGSGSVVGRYGPTDSPLSIEGDIVKLL